MTSTSIRILKYLPKYIMQMMEVTVAGTSTLGGENDV